jgi:hypothetical protein
MKTDDIINQPLKYFRATVSRGAGNVQRDGGLFGFGLIQGVSVITKGEALGHEMWIDGDFLSDVTGAINASESVSGGVKARFTHPGLSSDGMGRYLGRLKDAQTIGDQVFADLHLAEAATKTPDGNLADYVMTLAAEDPEAFGLSIVFEHDMEASEEHYKENTFNGRFVSPDEMNKDNHKHARLGRLRAGDIVDEPAANPNGLFHREQEIASEADSLMEYALGLSGEKPNLACLSVDADRVSAAVSRFMSRHNLTLTKKEGDPMSKDVEKVETPAADSQPTREQFAAELARFTTAFGAENGSKWFAESVSFSDGQTRHIEQLNRRIEGLQSQVGELQETLNSLNTGEAEPASYSEASGDAPAKKEQRSLASKIRISGKSYNNN